MARKPESEKNGGLRKGPWTQEEDQKLIDYIHKNGYGNWRTLPKNAGLLRCGKSCRLRWTNYLRPNIKRGKFSLDEEETIIQLHSILGNKWSTIASRLPGRTDNEIKNYWNTHIRKRLIQMGIDPVTHKPRLDLSSILSMTGIQPMVDLEHLRLAAWLLSFQGNKNLEYSYPSTQENNFESTLLVEDNSHHVLEHTFTQQIPSPFGVSFSNENYVILDDCHHVDHQSNFDNKLSLMSDFLSASTYSTSSSITPINENSSSVFISESNIE